ncbi:Hypothetical_protein [Hexamita inflata]|uniref:Hypothetical_protein n=1 Tax=Hexamita inflata TaxID=28002 RepID=A0AA86VH51_9EUKA|nr:Hypothetical protein HINF_LOCUS54108 [Hexamita inflata]
MVIVQCLLCLCAFIFKYLVGSKWLVGIYGYLSLVCGSLAFSISQIACFCFLFKSIANETCSGLLLSLRNVYHVVFQSQRQLEVAIYGYGSFIQLGLVLIQFINLTIIIKLLKVPNINKTDQIYGIPNEESQINQRAEIYYFVSGDQFDMEKQTTSPTLLQWTKFYFKLLCKSANGIIILIFNVFIGINQFMQNSIMKEYFTFVYHSNPDLTKPWYYLHMSFHLEQILNAVFTLMFGIIYDFYRSQNHLNRVLALISVVLFICFMTATIPSLLGVDLSVYHWIYSIFAPFQYGIILLTSMLTTFAVFKGNTVHRIIVCILTSIRYFILALLYTIEIWYCNIIEKPIYPIILIVLSAVLFNIVLQKAITLH